MTGFWSGRRGEVSGGCVYHYDNDDDDDYDDDAGEMGFGLLNGGTHLTGLLFVVLVERRTVEMSPDDGGGFILLTVSKDEVREIAIVFHTLFFFVFMFIVIIVAFIPWRTLWLF